MEAIQLLPVNSVYFKPSSETGSEPPQTHLISNKYVLKQTE
jgi:hypothetical protein